MQLHIENSPNVNSLNTLGARLRWLRITHSDSQLDVAQTVGCSPAAISQWERGQTVPSTDRVVLFLRHYRANFDWLFFGRGEPPVVPADAGRKRPLRVSISPTLSPASVATAFIGFTDAQREETFRIIGPGNVWDALARIVT